jgi:FtsP/CotA-like multicopper oxidase with cupredoxin domain
VALSARRRRVIATLCALAVVVPVAWMWQDSLLPGSYAATDMGYPELGGAAHDHSTAAENRAVSTLTAPGDSPADVSVQLVARAEKVEVAPGLVVDGYTLNGTSPGPALRVRQGDLVQVRLTNESVPDGVTLHWHGVDVPNAADGVAGVTQDAVRPGEAFTYRFVADRAGTYWYHAHQLSHEQVRRGLLGALVVEPADHPAPSDGAAAVLDQVALVHTYAGQRTINGDVGDVPQTAEPGTRVRVRIINSDNGAVPVWVDGAPFRMVAIDGTDVHEPTTVTDAYVPVTAGGRADLEFVTPADGSGVRVEMGGAAALVVGPARVKTTSPGRPREPVDPLTYGSPAPLDFDPAAADRDFEYRIGRRPGFVDGVPGMWWTVNGHLYPDVPMFMVAEGDVVRMRITNASSEVHPMHLHGHHAVVLARDGVPSRGSPWWVDSLDVGPRESYDIAFVADNPGIWMDHCHNLPHAAEGLVAHLMYEGVTASYLLGDGNEPE